MKEFLLNKIKATGTTTGDIYFPQTKLLLPFDGVNGATTTSDSSNRNATVTFNGNASLSTAQSKFGGSSCYFDGTGDSVSISDTYWNTAINSGDFTIELWVRFTVDEISYFLTNRPSGSGNMGWGLQRYASSNLQGQIILWRRDSSGWQYINYSQGTRTTISEDTWYHVAVTRNSNTWKLFLNGTVEDTVTNSNSIVASTDGELIMGGDSTTNYDLTGYLDDIRITSGIARYTSNFTAPTTTNPTSAGDVNKLILINETADGVAIGTAGINQTRIAKAWVNFNGTGTVAIRGSYNISSITDNGTGYYSINFSSNMTDVNYSAVGMAHEATDSASVDSAIRLYHDSYANVLQVSQVRIATGSSPTGGIQSFLHQDSDAVMVLIFGN
tara:strand:- start:46 stop:1200 length:1155 start_codon:yes stop_codon:yes gene_type:complete